MKRVGLWTIGIGNALHRGHPHCEARVRTRVLAGHGARTYLFAGISTTSYLPPMNTIPNPAAPTTLPQVRSYYSRLRVGQFMMEWREYHPRTAHR